MQGPWNQVTLVASLSPACRGGRPGCWTSSDGSPDHAYTVNAKQATWKARYRIVPRCRVSDQPAATERDLGRQGRKNQYSRTLADYERAISKAKPLTRLSQAHRQKGAAAAGDKPYC